MVLVDAFFSPFAFKSVSLGKEFPGAVKSDMERPSDPVVLLQIGNVFSASLLLFIQTTKVR